MPTKPTTEVWNDYLESFTPVAPSYIGTDPDFLDFEYYIARYKDTRLGLRYTFEIFGDQPSNGYPLFIGLHGGGGGDPAVNDGQWKMMATRLYGLNVEKYVKQGVYIAVRGLTRRGEKDTWNLHFNSETYFLLQQLIRNMFLKMPVEAAGRRDIQFSPANFVDPNRVFVLGFSAGGDGVYRLATVLSDVFAAASMGGGHPGSAVLSNLANVPICLSVGQWDGDENPQGEASRNVVTPEVATKLGQLQLSKPGYYNFEIFVHPTPFNLNSGSTGKPRSHNSWMRNHLTDEPRPIIGKWDDIKSWHDDTKRNNTDPKLYIDKNTCAVTWLNGRDGKLRKRDPVPPFVSWDVSPRKASEPEPALPLEWGSYRFSYWLAVDTKPVQETYNALQQSGIIDPDFVIRATYDKDKNEIWVQQTPTPVIILLNDKIIKDLSKPINLFHGRTRQPVKPVAVTQDYAIQYSTLLARGDPNYIFSASIVFDPVTATAKDGGSQLFAVRPKL